VALAKIISVKWMLMWKSLLHTCFCVHQWLDLPVATTLKRVKQLYIYSDSVSNLNVLYRKYRAGKMRQEPTSRASISCRNVAAGAAVLANVKAEPSEKRMISGNCT